MALAAHSPCCEIHGHIFEVYLHNRANQNPAVAAPISDLLAVLGGNTLLSLSDVRRLILEEDTKTREAIINKNSQGFEPMQVAKNGITGCYIRAKCATRLLWEHGIRRINLAATPWELRPMINRQATDVVMAQPAQARLFDDSRLMLSVKK